MSDSSVGNVSTARPRIAIVGGGLAGLAAAVALSDADCEISVFESRRTLGGRATSFRDPTTGELVDHCQHVSMGCCTNLSDFCRRTGLAESFRRDRVLHFFSPDGRRYDLHAASWLPAPMHLASSLMRLGYLTWREKFWIGVTLLRLARQPQSDLPGQPTIGQWLQQNHQSPQAIERFWSPVLVSALGETVDRASLSAARKVFVDAFIANRHGYEVEVPTLPLSALFGTRLESWLHERKVSLQLGTAIRRVSWSPGFSRSAALNSNTPAKAWTPTGPNTFFIETSDAKPQQFDFVILAVAWRRVNELLSDELRAACPALEKLSQIDAAPISGLHLWFDRPITDLPHAVLVGTLAQWLFNRNEAMTTQPATGYYYQVVISASRKFAGRDRQQIVDQVCSELRAVFPAAREAKLLNYRLVTEPSAVFSVRPGLDSIRPPQITPVPHLFLAGDYTATGWPATMEGAVRSGYLAAEEILHSLDKPQTFIQPDLPRNFLVRLLVGRSPRE